MSSIPESKIMVSQTLPTVTIIGQGYVGLPLAEAACIAGWKVYGYDVSADKVDSLNRAVSHVDDISDGQLAEMIRLGYCATTDPAVIEHSQVVVVCVPTPLGDGGAPDLSAVTKACETVSEHLQPGALFVLESTTYPGTTEGICKTILERGSTLKAGQDFMLAFSPERVNPGMTDFTIRTTPKLVGGFDEKSTRFAKDFYSSFIDEVVAMVGTREAETAKLLENTFRHVNIALVNEMAKFCHELGIDIWDVIDGAATKPFGFMPFRPGPGVGGHCIPIDPNYLSYEVRRSLGYPFRFVELAQEINNSMPHYVAQRSLLHLNDHGKTVRGSKVLLLGVTYKKDISDQRQSPAVPVARNLLKMGAKIQYHDPLVKRWNVSDDPRSSDIILESENDLIRAVEEADLVILLQAHSFYDVDRLVEGSAIFFDTVGATSHPAAIRL